MRCYGSDVKGQGTCAMATHNRTPDSNPHGGTDMRKATDTQRTPTSHEALQVAWVTPPPVLNGPIQLVPYSSEWPLLFEREATRIRSLLGNEVVRIEHVGSTSVPELSAKPIIDILLIVPNSADEAAYVPALAAAGYHLVIREPDWYEHRVFKGPDTNINLHTFSPQCPETERMLLFRDWLRTHPDDRLRYEATKHELAQRKWKYVQNYADAKSDVVAEILARATQVGNEETE
jgi:GrpB-like predicted nucleotidyltransferase (UPF0157 family)